MAPPRAVRQRPQLKGGQLDRSLILAGLLHVWLAVLVGTAPGDAREGEAAGGGKLTVRLQGPTTNAPGGSTTAQADRGPVGDAPSRRYGGTVRREDEPAPPDRPGAAREGEWAPEPAAVKQLPDMPSPPSPRGSRAEPVTPLTQTATETLRSEVPPAPSEVDPRVTRELTPAPAMPTPVQTARIEPLTRPLEAVQPVPRAELPAQSAERLNTQITAARIEAPQRLDRLTLPRPTELTSVPTLEAPAPKVATLASPSQPSPVSQPVRAQALPSLNTPVTTLSAAPTLSLPERSTARLNADSVRAAERVQAPALAPLAAQQTERARDLAPSPTLSPSEHAVAQLPAESASSAARISAPVPLARMTPSASLQAPLKGVQPLSLPAEGPAAATPGSAQAAASPASSPATASAPTPATQANAAATNAAPPAGALAPTGAASPTPGPTVAARPAQGRVSLTGSDPGQGPAAVPQPGSPDAGAQRGRDVATAPSAPASAPRLNLDLPMSQRGPVASSRSRALLELAPNPPELKTKLQKEMEKALREDCRKAYAENGLLALGGIALDALRAKGCKF
jgi:hypothetical protein